MGWTEDVGAALQAAELLLPGLLDSNGWNSLLIDYHPPKVERLWFPIGDGRILLHCIHPCETALFHPHPWPSAMRVLSGTYRMSIGSAAGIDEPPVVCCSQVTATPETQCRYIMDHPDGWHSVTPVGGPVYTVMVTGAPWDRPIPEVTREAGPMPELSPERKGELRRKFIEFYPGPWGT